LAIKPVTNTSINNYKIENKVIKIITLIVSLFYVLNDGVLRHNADVFE